MFKFEMSNAEKEGFKKVSECGLRELTSALVGSNLIFTEDVSDALTESFSKITALQQNPETSSSFLKISLSF